MSPSQFPFHGIFSSLGQEPAELTPAQGMFGNDDDQAQQQPKSVIPEHKPKQVGQVAVDIYEQDNYYIIKAPIAGVRLNDIDIEISDNIITIRGVRQQSDQVVGEQYYLQECFWGEFSRSVTMPCSIDPKKVKATFNKENVLKIIVPKEEKVKIVRINEG